MSYSSALKKLSTYESCAKHATTMVTALSKFQKALTECMHLSIPQVVSRIIVFLRTGLFYSELNCFLSWLRSALTRPSLNGSRGPCVSTPWTDSSPSPSSPLASLLSRTRLITRPARLRSAKQHEMLQSDAAVEETFTWSCWSTSLPLPSVADVITSIFKDIMLFAFKM